MIIALAELMLSTLAHAIG